MATDRPTAGPTLLSPLKDGAAPDFSRQHIESYIRVQKTCLSKLQGIWRDICYSPEQQQGVLEATALAAQNIWTGAVEVAEGTRQGIRDRIEDALREISKIKGQLEENNAPDANGSTAELQEYQEDVVSPRATLKELYDQVKANLDHWRDRRAAQLQKYEAIMAVHLALKQQLGMQHVHQSKADITATNLEFLMIENDKLQAEKARRQQRLEAQLDRLKGVCNEVGEDNRAAAADIHPSLRHVRDKESQEMLSSMYRLAGESPTDSPAQADLSEATFDKLETKIQDMFALKAEREAHAHELIEVLSSLWHALEIPEDAPDRSIFQKIMSGPYRLHSKSMEKCMGEVSRLEGCKTQAMRDLTLAKGRELQDLCAAAHITAPDISQLLADMSRRITDSAPGQIGEVLAKLVRMVVEVQAVAHKRGPIIALITELEEAQAESVWLTEYDQDENRYKGRDSNRKLQRAIKAGKMREKMPAVIDMLRSALREWQAAEASSFMYDGQDYQVSVLEAVAADLERVMADKEAKAKAAKEKPKAGTPACRGAKPVQAAGKPLPAVPKTPPIKIGGADKPMLTPRVTGDRRQSMAGAPPACSARDTGVYRSSSKSATTRSHDFTPGDFTRTLAQTALPTSTSATPTSAAAARASPATATATPATASVSRKQVVDPIQEKLMRIMHSSPKHAVATLQSRPRIMPPGSPQHSYITSIPEYDDLALDSTPKYKKTLTPKGSAVKLQQQSDQEDQEDDIHMMARAMSDVRLEEQRDSSRKDVAGRPAVLLAQSPGKVSRIPKLNLAF